MHIDLRTFPIYWINLDSEVERRQRMVSFFEKNGIQNTQRISGVENSYRGRGCALSHLNVLEQARDDMFLVLEDDCVPTEDFQLQFDIGVHADAYYMGLSGWAYDDRYSTPHLELNYQTFDDFGDSTHCRLFNMLSTHALVYMSDEWRKACIDTIISYYKNCDYHDKGYAKLQPKFRVYGQRKPFFYQLENDEYTRVCF